MASSKAPTVEQYPGKKRDRGKSCLRFKRLDDLPLDAVGGAIASTPPEALIAQYEASRRG